MKTIFTALVILGLFSGCVEDRDAPTSQPTKAKPTDADTSASPTEVAVADRLDPKVYDHFGDGIAKGSEAITIAAVAAEPKKHAGKKLRLTGKVASVCKKKGCWMVLADGPTKIRIRFRDYGFFMPLDCEGREAILDGNFEVKEVSVAEIKHLLEDEGKHEEAKKVEKPRHELTVIAGGVALKK